MTTPINSDKNPSLPTAHAPAARDGKTPVNHRPDGATAGNDNQSAAVARSDGDDVDIGRANQMLDLATGSHTQRPGGNIENDAQAKAVLSRFEALLAEDPGLALRAQASNLNEMHGVLLEVQPT